MAITKVTRQLLSTGINDNSNATAITIDSSENVGIGTASPAAELHVSAATTTQVRCESTTNSSTSTFQLATNGSDWNLSAGGSSQGTYPNGFYIYDAGADATRLVIDSSGNVGIGNASPSSYHSAARNLVVGSGSGSNGITITSATDGSSGIYFADGTSSGSQYDCFISANHTASALIFGTGATGGEDMRIDSGGVLSIGDTSPESGDLSSTKE